MTTPLTLRTVVNSTVVASRHITAPSAQFSWLQGLVDAAGTRQADASRVRDGGVRQADRGVDLPTLFEVLSRIPG